MTARIVLFGATGYTGGRTAEAMAARGLRPVLAGRDPARLEALATRLGGLDTERADVSDTWSVAALVGPGDVLVSTVGPFAKLGGPAVSAAVEAGAIYLDSTGEPPFIREVFERHGPAAERTGATLLTAFGNDYVPGVLAGALALRDAGDAAARVDVGYFVTGGGRGQAFSRGTLESLVGIATEPVYAWRGGALRTEPAAARMRTFDVAGRPRPGVTIGASEQFALPRLAPGLDTVDVYLGWFGPASHALHAGSRVTPLLGRIPGAASAVTWLSGLVTGRAAVGAVPRRARRVDVTLRRGGVRRVRHAAGQDPADLARRLRDHGGPARLGRRAGGRARGEGRGGARRRRRLRARRAHRGRRGGRDRHRPSRMTGTWSSAPITGPVNQRSSANASESSSR